MRHIEYSDFAISLFGLSLFLDIKIEEISNEFIYMFKKNDIIYNIEYVSYNKNIDPYKFPANNCMWRVSTYYHVYLDSFMSKLKITIRSEEYKRKLKLLIILNEI